jgi:hypothetical protein
MFGGGPLSIPDLTAGIFGGTRVGAGGVLNGLGIDFGNVTSAAMNRLLGNAPHGNLAAELIYAGTNNPALANIVQLIETGGTSNVIGAGAQVLGSVTKNPVIYDAARAIVSTQGGSKAGVALLAGSLVSGLLHASKTTQTPPASHVTQSDKGMSLSHASMAMINSTRSATSKIGKRKT